MIRSFGDAATERDFYGEDSRVARRLPKELWALIRRMHGRCAVRTTTDSPVDVRRMKRPPTHPGEMLLEEFLKPLGISQADAARRMKISTNRLNELIRGKRGVTAATALRLADLLGTSPEFWLNLQTGWDLWHAYRAERRKSAA